MGGGGVWDYVKWLWPTILIDISLEFDVVLVVDVGGSMLAEEVEGEALESIL